MRGLILSLLVLFAAQAQAARSSASSSAEQFLRYTLVFGANQGSDDTSGLQGSSGYTVNTTTNVEGGLLIDIKPFSFLGFRTGAEYVKRAFAVNQNLGTGGYQMQTVDIPAYLVFSFAPWFELFGGVNVGFKMSSGTTESNWTWNASPWSVNSTIIAPRAGLDFIFFDNFFIGGFYEFKTTLAQQGTGGSAWIFRGTSVGALVGYAF